MNDPKSPDLPEAAPDVQVPGAMRPPPLDPVISDAREKAPRTVAASARRGGALKRASTLLLWAIVVFFVAVFAWVSVGEVYSVTRAQGRVIPSSKLQMVQNLEGGIVTEIRVAQGQRVKEGDLMLALDAEGKGAAVESARASLDQREKEYEASERLAKRGSLPKLQLDNARSALAAARSALEKAEAELGQMEVRAPFSGIIDTVSVEQGSSVQQGAPIATLLQLDPVIAIGEVSERDLVHMAIGGKAEVRLVSGQTAQGTVRYISRQANAATRTFAVEIAIPNPQAAIPAGMTAEITLSTEPVQAVMLPRSVVTLSDKGDLGIRIAKADNTVAFVPIDLIDDTTRGLVLGGVPSDARIIVAGQDLVADGETVNAVEADEAMLRRLAGTLAD